MVLNGVEPECLVQDAKPRERGQTSGSESLQSEPQLSFEELVAHIYVQNQQILSLLSQMVAQQADLIQALVEDEDDEEPRYSMDGKKIS